MPLLLETLDLSEILSHFKWRQTQGTIHKTQIETNCKSKDPMSL